MNKERVYISKFKNIDGVTCYMNSILHILQHVKPFMIFILTKSNFLENSVNYGLYNLFYSSLNNEDISINPVDFRKIIGSKNSIWISYQQQDSQEFLLFILNELEKELGRKCNFIPKDNIKSLQYKMPFLIDNIITSRFWNITQLNIYSDLKNMFYGIHQNKYTCKYCNSSHFTNDVISIMQLNIPNSTNSKINVYDCLNYTFINNDSDNYIIQCNFCGLTNNIKSQTKLWKTPEILILQFVRFTNDLNKIKTNIEYPIYNLNLYTYFNNTSPYINNCLYDLIGINIHHDINGMNYGHYTSIIKNIFNENWYYYNDDNPIIKINNINDLQNNNAYILFYKLKI